MPNDRTKHDGEQHEHSAGRGKRDGRESVEPRAQPGEFADDMRVNRFTPPPPPSPAKDDEK